MIPRKILSLFEFIDYLDTNKAEYIEKYLPLCDELEQLDIKRSEMKPRDNYIDKQRYDAIQKEIADKFKPINENIYLPVINRLKELGIWGGDDVFTSMRNNNVSAIYTFKETFKSEDVDIVMLYKHKYLNFRRETNSNFMCLQLILSDLDDIFKELFDFFKDTNENEFESFEAKVIKVNSIEDALKGIENTKSANVRFEISKESLFYHPNTKQDLPHVYNIKNELIMGNKIKIGDITNSAGPIIIGEHIRLSNSFNEKITTTEKISNLIDLIRREHNLDEEQKQILITSFDKIKEELYKGEPSKSQIFKWLSNTHGVLEKFVLSHDVTQAVEWVYRNLNFIVT